MTNNTLTAESGFFGQVRKYGLKKLILSWDFLICLCVLVALLLNDVFSWKIFNLDSNALTFIVTVASAIFAVLITALAIILSFSSSKFVKFLRDKNLFDGIIFIFWWASLAFLTVLLLSFAKYLISLDIAWLRSLSTATIISIFIYGLIETYFVIGALMRFAYFLGVFESKDKS